jgi:hypothetical protein
MTVYPNGRPHETPTSPEVTWPGTARLFFLSQAAISSRNRGLKMQEMWFAPLISTTGQSLRTSGKNRADPGRIDPTTRTAPQSAGPRWPGA